MDKRTLILDAMRALLREGRAGTTSVSDLAEPMIAETAGPARNNGKSGTAQSRQSCCDRIVRDSNKEEINMDTITAISVRRSIRKFDAKPVPREMIERILTAGIEAPSAKNRQPWRFVVVTDGGDKPAMLQAMRAGLEWMDQNGEFDPALMKGAWYTLGIMERAPVTIFILNPEGKTPFMGLEPLGERFTELANVQSIGACIQNMCLAATDLGLGSLWICDVFQAYHALIEWLGTDAQLVAALSIGHALEQPRARPRNPLAEVATWR